MGRQKLDLKEAAEILDTTTEAVRKRAKRGTLDSETGPDGKLYVWVDDQVDGRVDDRHDELIERMASEIDHLREQLKEEREANKENRRIIAGLVQRVPELEAASEARDDRVAASEEPGKGEDRVEETAPERPSWWQRLFR